MVTLTGTAPLESHDVKLYIRLHIYISIYVYTRVFCMCERTHKQFYVQPFMCSFLATQTIIFHVSSVYMGNFKSQILY